MRRGAGREPTRSSPESVGLGRSPRPASGPSLLLAMRGLLEAERLGGTTRGRPLGFVSSAIGREVPSRGLALDLRHRLRHHCLQLLRFPIPLHSHHRVAGCARAPPVPIGEAPSASAPGSLLLVAPKRRSFSTGRFGYTGSQDDQPEPQPIFCLPNECGTWDCNRRSCSCPSPPSRLACRLGESTPGWTVHLLSCEVLGYAPSFSQASLFVKQFLHLFYVSSRLARLRPRPLGW